jgi:hypothetical protein
LDFDEHWYVIGALANTAIILFLSSDFQFDWFVTQPYALSLSLSFAGLLLLDFPGTAAVLLGTLLIVLAHWVNLAVVLVLLPFVCLQRRLIGRALPATLTGIATGFFLKQFVGVPQASNATLRLAEWPHGWLQLLRTLSREVNYPWLLASLLLLAVASTVAAERHRPRPDRTRSIALLVTVAVLHWLILGTLKHVQLNDYLPRYTLPSVVLAAVALATALIPARVSARAFQSVSVATLALLLTVAALYGPPSPARVVRTIDRKFGMLTPDIIGNGATVIVGDYWTVWPAVFHANLVLYRNGDSARRVYGLTYRSEATDPLWLRDASAGRIVLAARQGDNAVAPLLDRSPVPIHLIGHNGLVELFVAGEEQRGRHSGVGRVNPERQHPSVK